MAHVLETGRKPLIIRIKELEEKVTELEKSLKALSDVAWSFTKRLNELEQDYCDRQNAARRLARYGNGGRDTTIPR